MKTGTTIAWTALALLTAAVWLQQQTTAQQQYTAGDTVCFTVAAIDSNGDTIHDWDQKGQSCSITLVGSTANTDTSEQSWGEHPDGFSFAVILHNGAPLATLDTDQWALPANIFTAGKATLCLVHTKSDTGVSITLCAEIPELRTDSVRYHYQPGPVENFLVEITSTTSEPDQVYLMRKYEIIVSPRDRFLNVSNRQVKCYFAARYPDEFVNSQPGFSSIFYGAVFITGPTNYFVASTYPHAKEFGQWIVAIDSTIGAYGRSNPYAIIDHAPGPFELVEPLDQIFVLYLHDAIDEKFTWTRSVDPYRNISISRFSPEVDNDIVTYTTHFVDSLTLTKKVSFPSDTAGKSTQFTSTQGEILFFGKGISGASFYDASLMWYVEATDGLYITQNTPHDQTRLLPGRYYILDVGYPPTAVSHIPSAPTGIALHQNYPNPVPSGTMANIRFETTGYGPVRMKVYDMLGSEVATLADETLAPGAYTADFSAVGLAPGVYHYTLTAGGQTTTRSMVITK